MAPRIFVNFRRADTGPTGPHLDTALRREFGEQEVFRDQRSIRKGAHFPAEITGALRRCDLLLAVMGQRWASVTDDEGRRCIDDPEDWVRKEIAMALTLGITVLPVLVDGAGLPDAAELPAEIRNLTGHQGVFFRPHQEHIDFPPLFEAVHKAVPDLRRRRPRRPQGDGGGATNHIENFHHGSATFGGTGNTANTFNDPEDYDGNAHEHD
ncbi:toll/interleukin-1 receptor domain-containing protein [Streptomyces sp. NPDC056373]|uniref:toll/interleukin-1 receptor domain-containing protein n=1 Tax=Streptomyces sp. NPDC056373 TaxID=3345798 RepID=UPI0035E26FAD